MRVYKNVTRRRDVKHLGLTQRRDDATTKKIKRLMKVFKTSRSGVAAWRETFKPHVASLRRGVKKNKPHATALRRNEKLKKN